MLHQQGPTSPDIRVLSGSYREEVQTAHMLDSLKGIADYSNGIF